jgi:hypothetical protein
MIKDLLLLAASLIFGTPAVKAEDPVRKEGPRLHGDYCGTSGALSSVIPGARSPHPVVARYLADRAKKTTVVVYAGNPRTLAWNPGLHRYCSAEWFMDGIRDAPGTIGIQREYTGAGIRMYAPGDPGGIPLCQAIIRETGSDTHRFHAISGYSRSAGTVPTSYRYSKGSERIDC